MAGSCVTRTCGHQERVNVPSAGRRREGLLAWHAKQPCRMCRREAERKARAEAHQVAGEKARAEAAAAGLPPLEGSERQVAWAEQIRRGILVEADKILAEASGDPVRLAALAPAAQEVRGRISAQWWIKRRYESAERLLRQA